MTKLHYTDPLYEEITWEEIGDNTIRSFNGWVNIGAGVPKLYYTDPLAAVMMVRDFGIELGLKVPDYYGVNKNGRPSYGSADMLDISWEEMLQHFLDGRYDGKKLYPDPYDYLEYSFFKVRPTDKTKIVTIKDDTGETIGFREEIEKRDGKKFHMPQFN